MHLQKCHVKKWEQRTRIGALMSEYFEELIMYHHVFRKYLQKETHHIKNRQKLEIPMSAPSPGKRVCDWKQKWALNFMGLNYFRKKLLRGHPVGICECDYCCFLVCEIVKFFVCVQRKCFHLVKLGIFFFVGHRNLFFNLHFESVMIHSIYT